ncbi:digalactosyldiacylglycerol synthase 1 chloroplastic [Prunus yedoensis var. nudiflora]|uniref:Digalactosyldiacylglycerol synthase 1 chloroplastic n=1 Tax=Prunus yedoensis var. nudiflora TaxID=2094558 RepID=A0A314V2U8_PRUYE|nr:digalactosyldiacylglycerol synthase 1 chloroplastic [Prunus yedoensis var. nudiflora]
MKHRANEFKNLATSFDRELENLFKFNSASAIRSSPRSEIDFVKRLQPKLRVSEGVLVAGLQQEGAGEVGPEVQDSD